MKFVYTRYCEALGWYEGSHEHTREVVAAYDVLDQVFDYERDHLPLVELSIPPFLRA